VKRERTRPIPTLNNRERQAFEQQISRDESGHELWCVGGDTWWGRWRTEGTWAGAEFRTENGEWFRAARVARVLAGHADDSRYLHSVCGVERCVKAEHQEFLQAGATSKVKG